jgi:hypothetical protein
MGDDEENQKELEGTGKNDELAPFLAKEDAELKPYQRLITSKRAYSLSLWALRACVLADAINSTILKPNYPFIVTPGLTPVRYRYLYVSYHHPALPTSCTTLD